VQADRIKPKVGSLQASYASGMVKKAMDLNLVQSEMSGKMTELVFKIQSNMVNALEKFDARKFTLDHWEKDDRFGCSAVLQEGSTFEKAGVNVSVIKSKAPKAMIQNMTARKLDVDPSVDYDFFVAGVSMVIHPLNPFCPTMHANYRYFELLKDDVVVESWFGGGCDLTPAYLFEQDAIHFHSVIKNVCDKHDKSFYPRFKEWCDKYFYNTHRGEARGLFLFKKVLEGYFLMI
jgi:coproporphyrinogen III oxidase